MVMTVDLSEAKDQLPSLLDRAVAGEEVVITRDGQPVAKLVPVPKIGQEPRKPANALGVTYIADDFDAPLPPDLLKQFGYDPRQ